MLGLEPHGEHLVVDPALPRSIGHLELLDIPGRWGRIDAFGRAGRGRKEAKRRRWLDQASVSFPQRRSLRSRPRRR
jgi:hypothetical protein